MKEKAKYIHLFEELKRRILQGEYQNGQRLPGENEMAGEFSMSRQTVRQALSLLSRRALSSAARAAAPMCAGWSAAGSALGTWG